VHRPEEHGGGGAGLSELSAVIEETAATGVPVLSAIFSAGVNGTILAQHGTDGQKDRWLRPLAERTAMSSFAITEPDAETTRSRSCSWWHGRAADGSRCSSSMQTPTALRDR